MKNIQKAVNFWLKNSEEEAIELDLFPGKPIILRRLKEFPKTLAKLTFGQYCDMQNQKVASDFTIWIDFITSEESGQGKNLISFLKLMANEYELALGAKPQPLKPKEWQNNRCFYYKSEDMIAWYKKHQLGEIKFKNHSQVWYFPASLKPEVNLSISHKISQVE